jgi:hypothetical protein
MMTHRVELTLPPKETPYTQDDCDAVIFHPIMLNMAMPGEEYMRGIGRIEAAVLNDDGSATITAEVKFG